MKKKCILYGNCQAIIYVYELLNNLPEFKKHYDLISYVNHDREQTKKLVNIDVDELIQELRVIILDEFVYRLS